MAALPDPAVIAKLASEFFAALPGALGITGVSGGRSRRPVFPWRPVQLRMSRPCFRLLDLHFPAT